jgi:hypothetical protein
MMRQSFGGGVVEHVVQVAVIPLIEDEAFDRRRQVVEIDDHSVGIERTAHGDVQPVRVPVQMTTLPLVPRESVGRFEGEAAGDTGPDRSHGRDANPLVSRSRFPQFESRCPGRLDDDGRHHGIRRNAGLFGRG